MSKSHQILMFVLLLLVSQQILAGELYVPSTPPVHVYTGVDEKYTGYGVLDFKVVLPLEDTPEFTLGGDEDATYHFSDIQYDIKGVVYVDKAHLGNLESDESAWIIGKIDSQLLNDVFVKQGVRFNLRSSQNGVFIGSRDTSAKRLTRIGSTVVDYAYTSLWMYVGLHESHRYEASAANGGPYVDDSATNSYGVAWRPTVTLQATMKLTSNARFIPFVGATSFIALGYSTWETSYWEDKNYGAECQTETCYNSDFFYRFIPMETFAGFDFEYRLSNSSKLSLASFFSAGTSTDTDSMSETYVLYSKTFN